MGQTFPAVFNITDAIFSPWDTNEAKDRVAVLYEDHVWSYRDLIDEINKVALGLNALGIEREQRVLLIGYDSPYFLAIMFGAMKIGAIPVPVNTQLPPQDYLFFLEDSRARVLVVEPDIWTQLAPLLVHRAPDLRAAVIFPGHSAPALPVTGYGGPLYLYAPWTAQFSGSAAPSAPTSPDEMAFWLYSSGSTGKPKAAVHRHRDMWVCNQSYARGVLDVSETDRLYSASKLYFAYGLGNGSYFALANGASVVLVPDRVDPVNVLNTLEKTQATLFFGVPTLYNAMLQVDPTREWDLRHVRAAVSAGEPLPAEIYHRFRERFGIEILDGIGSTEALHIYISNWPGQSRAGLTGQVVPGYEVKIVDEAGVPVPPGTIGDLYVKGDSVAAYYWNQADKTRRSMQGEWFYTGDKFLQTEEKYFLYCGRSDDMIKVGGIWVSPVEVENTLIQHPAVLEAAVVGKTGTDGLERPVAYVVLKSHTPKNDQLVPELQSFVKERLAHYKYPREILFVDHLPKTASGKIQRFRLRESLQVS